MADTYDVTGQREVIDLGGPDGTQRAMEVTFKTKPSEVTGSVRIPLAQFSPIEAAKVISAYVATIEAVHAL